jgi:predicted transcriptional regulator
MAPKTLNDVLERAKTWPEEDRETLIEYARELEARRTGVYLLNDGERAAIAVGRAQAARGEFATDQEMAALWKEFGL